MATFIDSHAHLADLVFANDVDDVVQRARDAGALATVCIGASIEAADEAARLFARFPDFLAYTAGVHPHDAAGFDQDRDLPLLRAHLAAGAVAVGECGLDYHYDNSPRQQQREVFRAQLALAAEADCPVVVHTRDAEADTAALISEAAEQGVVGVLHCYTGSTDLANRAIALGWYVSFSGIITFRNWTDTALLRLIPDDRLLVESDSPYLAPVPKRGKRNEPAWVAHTLARLATVRDISADTLGEITTANVSRLFGLAIPGQ